MDGYTLTYLAMGTVIIAELMCVIHLSKRSDRFEDEVGTYINKLNNVTREHVTLKARYNDVVDRNQLLTVVLDAKFTDLVFKPDVHIHQGGTTKTYCGMTLDTDVTAVSWEQAAKTSCSSCARHFNNTPTMVETQLSLFHQTGIGYLEYTD